MTPIDDIINTLTEVLQLLGDLPQELCKCEPGVYCNLHKTEDKLADLLVEISESKETKRYLIEEQARFCKRCGQEMFYDEDSDICGTCVGEIKRSGYKGYKFNINMSPWTKPIK